MDWLVDLGNTRLKCAPLLADGRRGDVHALVHDGGVAGLDWRASLPVSGGRAWLASVASPALRADVVAALAAAGCDVREAATQARVAGVTVAYAEPARLGIDRALAMAAAHAQGRGDALVVGVGTALTIDWVDASGLHRGGRIAPSPALMRAALHARAAQLPEAGGVLVDFASDTADALASGCLGAALALVAEARRAAMAAGGHDGPPAPWLHGGGAAALVPHIDGAVHAPHLVLDGLALWARGQDGR